MSAARALSPLRKRRRSTHCTKGTLRWQDILWLLSIPAMLRDTEDRPDVNDIGRKLAGFV